MTHHQGRDTCAECGSLNADTGNLCQQCRDEEGYGERFSDDVCQCSAKGRSRKNAPISRTEHSYRSMRTRVRNANIQRAKHYSGRGIDCDPRWDNFKAFLADMGERPEGTTLDRIDNDKGYWPDNCRWATASQQARNKTNTVFVILNGERTALASALEALGRKWGHYRDARWRKNGEKLTAQEAIDKFVKMGSIQGRRTEMSCANGHPYTEGSFYINSGLVRCRTCVSAVNRRRYEKMACRSDMAGLVPCRAITSEGRAA